MKIEYGVAGKNYKYICLIADAILNMEQLFYEWYWMWEDYILVQVLVQGLHDAIRSTVYWTPKLVGLRYKEARYTKQKKSRVF